MRFNFSTRHVKYSLVLTPSLPLAWLLSHGNIGIEFSSYVHRVVGLWIPSFLLLTVILMLAFIGLYVLGTSILKLVGLQFVLYILPALGGLPVKLLPGYILGGLLYISSLLLAKHVEWVSREMPGVSGEELEFAGISAIGEILLPIPLGLGYFFLFFIGSSWGRSPANMFPFYLLLPFLVGAAVAVTSSFSGESKETPGDASRTFLVLRTYMTAGDSFTVEYLGRDERKVTFGLVGGSPVKRPLLLKIEWNEGIPEVVVLRSPWENRVLTKKREWIEGDKRYVLFMG